MSRPSAIDRRIALCERTAKESPNLFERIAATAAVERLKRARLVSEGQVRTRRFGRLPADHRHQALICQSSPARFTWREREFIFRMRYADRPTPKQAAYLAMMTRRALEVSNEPA